MLRYILRFKSFLSNRLTTAGVGRIVGLAVLLAALLLMAHSHWAAAQDDGYTFPVAPGTEAWEALRSHQEMLDVTQIPPEVLERMSTAGLVSTILNYPLFGDFLAFNTLQDGFTAVARFNGIQTLLVREDGAAALADRYTTMDLGEMLRTDYLPSTRISYTELIMAQEDLLNQLDAAQRADLLQKTMAQAEAKLSFEGRFNLRGSIFLAGRLLQMDNAEFQALVRSDARLQNFLAAGSVEAFEADELVELLTIMQDLINGN